MFTNSPGGNVNFEAAPFKLTEEYVEVMGGEDSETFSYFKVLFMKGLLELRRYAHRFMLLVHVMQAGSCKMPCFVGGATALHSLKARFALDITDEAFIEHCMELVEESVGNWRSSQYDKYQRAVNDIR